MKTCEEMVASLLARRAQYAAEQKRRRTLAVHAAASLCCVCLAVLCGIGIQQNRRSDPPPEQTVGESSTILPRDSTGGCTDTVPPVPADQIQIQPIDAIPTPARALFMLHGDDFIPMNREEISAYYGINIFPAVPEDLTEAPGHMLGIYKRGKGRGELYWDSNAISYSSADASRHLQVSVDRDCVPFDFCNLFDDVQSRSLINSIEVGLAQTPAGELYAEFLHAGVGFRIVAVGLTQEELLAVVHSLLVG